MDLKKAFIIQQFFYLRVKRFPDKNTFYIFPVRQMNVQYSWRIFDIFYFRIRYGYKSAFLLNKEARFLSPY